MTNATDQPATIIERDEAPVFTIPQPKPTLKVADRKLPLQARPSS